MATRACGEAESRRGRLLRNPHKDVKRARLGGWVLPEREGAASHSDTSTEIAVYCGTGVRGESHSPREAVRLRHRRKRGAVSVLHSSCEPDLDLFGKVGCALLAAVLVRKSFPAKLHLALRIVAEADQQELVDSLHS